jgi:hypothetical protein
MALMSPKITVAALTAVVVLLACVVVYLLVARVPMSSEARSKIEKFDERCKYIRVALDSDVKDFADPATREAALRRFSGPSAGHSYDEITMCAATKVDLSKHDSCLLSSDFACMAELARQARDSIPAN